MATTHHVNTTKSINELCDIVRETAFAIHVFHGHGHLEKVYENALVHRLRKAGFDVQQQHPIQVFDQDGTVIGEYFVDILIEGRLLVELKATKHPADEHVAQILGYLKSTRIEHGLLVNFGTYKFAIRKFALSQSGWSSRLPTSGVIPALILAFLAFFRGNSSPCISSFASFFWD